MLPGSLLVAWVKGSTRVSHSSLRSGRTVILTTMKIMAGSFGCGLRGGCGRGSGRRVHLTIKGSAGQSRRTAEGPGPLAGGGRQASGPGRLGSDRLLRERLHEDVERAPGSEHVVRFELGHAMADHEHLLAFPPRHQPGAVAAVGREMDAGQADQAGLDGRSG